MKKTGKNRDSGTPEGDGRKRKGKTERKNGEAVQKGKKNREKRVNFGRKKAISGTGLI